MTPLPHPVALHPGTLVSIAVDSISDSGVSVVSMLEASDQKDSSKLRVSLNGRREAQLLSPDLNIHISNPNTMDFL